MTDRELLQQALETLCTCWPIAVDEDFPELLALRNSAIAAMQERLARPHPMDPCQCGKETLGWCLQNSCHKAGTRPEPKPMAWVGGGQVLLGLDEVAEVKSKGFKVRPLVYGDTRPQPAAPAYPLPDNLYDSKDWRAGNYAGRVEWLHGIYEAKKRELDAYLEQPAAAIPDGWRLVNEGALRTAVNILRRDAQAGRLVRGEVADALLSAAPKEHNFGDPKP